MSLQTKHQHIRGLCDLLPALQDWETKVRVWDPPRVRTGIKTPLALGWVSKEMHAKKSKKEPRGGTEK